MEIVDSFLDGSDARTKVHAFEAPRNFHKPLKILAADFRLAGVRTDRCKGAESRGATGGAGEERVAHTI